MNKKNISTLHLMVGLPCSGKTEKAKHLAKEYNAVVFSPDAWLMQLYGKFLTKQHHEMRDNLEKQMIEVAKESLKNGINVILDFGFWSKDERDNLKDMAKRCNANFIMHFMDVPEDDLFLRLEKRNSNPSKNSFIIEKKDLKNWLSLLEKPSGNELSYTKIYYTKENFGNYNIFMQCDKINKNSFSSIPSGYSIRLCKENELEVWAKLAGGEYWKFVINYYNQVYKPRKKEFFAKCTFIVNEKDEPVSTCFIWKSYKKIKTIAWLRTLPEYEGKGLASALISHLLESEKSPIFLHTHPTLFKAIKTYSKFGFKFVDSDFVGYRSNDLRECYDYMKKQTDKWFEDIDIIKPHKNLTEAALSSVVGEF